MPSAAPLKDKPQQLRLLFERSDNIRITSPWPPRRRYESNAGARDRPAVRADYGGTFRMALYPFVTDQCGCANIPPNGYNKSALLRSCARRAHEGCVPLMIRRVASRSTPALGSASPKRSPMILLLSASRNRRFLHPMHPRIRQLGQAKTAAALIAQSIPGHS